MCDECLLLDTKRESAYIRKSRLENQLLCAGLDNFTSIADDYSRSISECDLLFNAYREHQKARHGVTVHYVGRLSGGEE